MKMTIVYDNEVFDKRLVSGWGLSCFLQMDKNDILFDTGWDGNTLLSNMQVLNINPKKIEKVVLSHEHWDHIGGLTNLLNVNQNLEVYVPKSFGKRLKEEIANRANLVEVSEPYEITEECISTGELGSQIKEQSIMIKTKKGLIVITGCAHPRLNVILNTAKEFDKIYGVIGGFHGFKEYDLLSEIPLIAPCHCTFHKQEIAMHYPEACDICGAGKRIEI